MKGDSCSMNNSRSWIFFLLTALSACLLIIGIQFPDPVLKILQSSILNKIAHVNFTYDPFIKRYIIFRFILFLLGLALILIYRLSILKSIYSFFNKYHSFISAFSFLAFASFVLKSFYEWNFYNTPVIQDDYAVHFTEAVAQAANLKNNFKLWGYNPFFCSGMINFGIDTLWPAIFILSLQNILSAFTAFNLSILFSFFVPSGLIFLTANNLHLNPFQRSLLFIINLFFIIAMSPFFYFYQFGCNGFVLSSYLAVYLLSLTIRSIKELNPGTLIPLLFFGAFLVALHPLGALTFVILFCPFIFFFRNYLSIKLICWWICGLVIPVIITANWFIPYISTLPGKDLLINSYMQTNNLTLTKTLLENLPFSALLITAFFSAYSLFKQTSNDKYLHTLTKSLIAGSILIGIIAFYGSQIGLYSTQPERFIIPFSIILSIIISITPFFPGNNNFIRLVFILIFFFLLQPIPIHYIYKYDCHSDIQRIFSYLKKNNDGSRLLIQDSDNHPYCNTHLSSWIPQEAGMETTAHPYTGLRPLFTQFINDTLFNKSLNTLSSNHLHKYIKLYNIGWIMVYSDSARTFFNRQKNIYPVISTGKANLYKTTIIHDLCSQGSAQINATYDRIYVKNSVSDTLVLKYHFYKYLKAYPKHVKIDGVFIEKDPIPFIRLINAKGNSFVFF